jgi:glycosyltransferase involved in cell wall biosynthesis
MSILRGSVAMCTYNGSIYLSEQLESIESQTRLPDELVVCDDGSTDDTLRVLNAFASQASFPVRIFSNEERLGPTKNFEKAVRLCEGDVIFLADQDDVWKPQKVERLLDVFEQHPTAVYVFSDAETIDEKGVIQNRKLWDLVGLRQNLDEFSGPGQVRFLLKENLITGAAMAFRASFRDIVLPIPTEWMHDYWIAMIGSALSSGVPVSQSLFMYRRHARQVIGVGGKGFLTASRISLATSNKEWREKVRCFRLLEERILSHAASGKVSPECVRLLKEKETHLLARANTRSSKGISRVMNLLVEASTGRYHRFSDSWRSIARDLWSGSRV